MNENPKANTSKEPTENYCVPAGFPRFIEHGAVPGAQPKFLATKYQGKIYVAGSTPPEVYARWEVCEDLAFQIQQRALASKAGKRSHMCEQEILTQYLPRLIKMRWTSEAEARWIIRRVAEMLGWPAPSASWENE
jgi:hypothetical protein